MSSSHLCPCPACNRHVMTDAGVCPFCQVALPASFCETPVPSAARGRMSRAARLLVGATLVGVSACSSTQPEPRADAAYGGSPIPVDSGVGGAAGSGAGGAAGSGAGGAPSNDAAEDRGAVALYGAPAPTDGSASG